MKHQSSNNVGKYIKNIVHRETVNYPFIDVSRF